GVSDANLKAEAIDITLPGTRRLTGAEHPITKTLNEIVSVFGSAVKTRFFPSFFPFTEPSADVQISCIFCGGRGCRKCKQSGWIELLGCGMVDPAVFAFAAEKQPAYDPKKISGFAFGMGVERIAMMKYGISEIGQFFAGDMRFLSQFA
ncbi:MAG: hypothetical protein WBL41_17870, partial [Terracidiphilus sp.]